MKAIDYSKHQVINVAAVRLVQKAKRCGKPNCTECPHGGFWYAYVPASVAKDGARHEVYLGKTWIGYGLKESIGPRLASGARREFVAEIDGVERLERIAELKAKIEQQQRAIKEVVARHLREVEKLRGDLAKMTAELKRLQRAG